MELSYDKPYAFTVEHDQRVPILITPAGIGEPFERLQNMPSPPKMDYTAIWDTGATGTVITEKVAQDCSLKPVGITRVNTANGERDSQVYFVSVYLPHKVAIRQLRVTEGIFSGPDILIGMDIISQGDFAITNKDGKTVFTFRMPSMEVIDFVEKTAPKSSNNVIPTPTGSRAERRRAKFGR